MRKCMRLMLSLVVGLAWVAATAADEPDMFGFLTQASYWDQTALQGDGGATPYGNASPMSGYGPGWEQQALSGQEGWPGCGRGPCRSPLTVSADLVVMERVGGRPSTLISNSTSGDPLLNVTDLNFSFAPGPRLDFLYHGNCGWDVELGYLAVEGWNATAFRADSGGGIEFAAPDFTAAVAGGTNTLRFDYFSRLYTVEANLRNRLGDRITLLGGFRWAKLAEKFEGSFFDPPPVDSALRFWRNSVDNELYGFQVGGQCIVIDEGRLRVEAVAKAGIYGNRAHQATTAPFPDDLPGASAWGTRGAFLGEAGVTALWQASERVTWRLGYQAMWLDGVALSPNQIHVTDVVSGAAVVDMTGTAFFHGAVAGVQVDF